MTKSEGSFLGKKFEFCETMFFRELSDSESKKTFFRFFEFGDEKIEFGDVEFSGEPHIRFR